MGKPKVRILIVDDDISTLQTLEEFLKDSGFKVYTAESAQKAQEKLENEKIDVVIADLVMPRMNGIALTRAIKETGRDIPVIIMTAYASIEYAVESMKAGAFDFISKPFQFNHALFVLEKALETRQLQSLAKKSEYYKKLSHIDELTKIYNYRHFKQAIITEISRHRRYKRPLSLLMVDIDNFKHFNDTHGHVNGDVALRQIARVLTRSVRGCDIVARYGGEEFTVILPETPEGEALMVGKRIVSTVQNYQIKSSGGSLLNKLSVTVGLATFPKDAITPHKLVEKADQALYQGKADGKNQIRVFEKTASERLS